MAPRLWIWLAAVLLLPIAARAETITLEIHTPKDKAEQVGAGIVFVSGLALAHEGRRPKLDIVFVIDVSGSTAAASGADVDRDGSVGRGLVIPGVIATDAGGDSVLAAEVAAVGLVLERLDPQSTRVGIVTFSDSTWVDVPLTRDYDEVRIALRDILDRGASGGTNMKSAVLRGSVELLGTKSAASTRRRDADRTLVLVTDGAPTLPHPSAFGGSSDINVRVAVNAATKAGRRGIRVHTFAVGKEAVGSPAPRQIARAANGIYTPVVDPSRLPHIFDEFNFSQIETLTVRNITMNADSVQFEHQPDGSFSALVPAGIGTQTLEVHARSLAGTEERRRVVIVRGPQPLKARQRAQRDLLLELERQRQVRQGERARDLEIKPER